MSSRAAKILFINIKIWNEKNKKINMIEKRERENRDCEKCGKLTEVYFSKRWRRPFLICISCDKTKI